MSEIERSVSQILETSLATHLHLNRINAKILVKEDILFGKLTDQPFIKRIQDDLEKIDVLLYLSNENTKQMSLMSWGTFVFYTNTNLMVEITIPRQNGPIMVRVRIYTEDKQIDFQYGIFDGSGSPYLFGGMTPSYPAETNKLIECRSKIHKYIHPKIYLDYYMHCASEQDMNELIHSNNLIDMINKLISSNENYKHEILKLKEKCEIEIKCKTDKIIECENNIKKLEEKNDNLNIISSTLKLDLDNVKSENESKDIVIFEEKEKNDNLNIIISTLKLDLDNVKSQNECKDTVIVEEKEKNNNLKSIIEMLRFKIDNIKNQDERYSYIFNFRGIFILTIFILYM